MRTHSSEAYIRLPNARRKVTSKRVRFPWRERRRRQRIRLSRAQKEELKRQRDEKKEKITNALLEARTAMWEFALKMHEDFPCHSARSTCVHLPSGCAARRIPVRDAHLAS